MIYINLNLLPSCYFVVFEALILTTKGSLGVHVHIPHVHENSFIHALSTSCLHTRTPCACVQVSFLVCRVYKNLTFLLSATEAPCPPPPQVADSPRHHEGEDE